MQVLILSLTHHIVGEPPNAHNIGDVMRFVWPLKAPPPHTFLPTLKWAEIWTFIGSPNKGRRGGVMQGWGVARQGGGGG